MMKQCGVLNWVALILVIIGALNWGLVGAFSLDVVKMLFGDMTNISRIIYIVIGVAGLYKLVCAIRCCGKSE